MEYIKKLISIASEYSKLKNLIRFNTRLRLKDESVAEHIFIVQLLALNIYYSIGTIKNKLDLKNILLISLIHDLPEKDLSDLPYTVKEIFKKNIPAFDMVTQTLEVSTFMNNNLQLLYAEWLENKTLESQIVKLADIISVIEYSDQEMKLNNNKNFKPIYLDGVRRAKNQLNKIKGNKNFNSIVIEDCKL